MFIHTPNTCPDGDSCQELLTPTGRLPRHLCTLTMVKSVLARVAAVGIHTGCIGPARPRLAPDLAEKVSLALTTWPAATNFNQRRQRAQSFGLTDDWIPCLALSNASFDEWVGLCVTRTVGHTALALYGMVTAVVPYAAVGDFRFGRPILEVTTALEAPRDYAVEHNQRERAAQELLDWYHEVLFNQPAASPLPSRPADLQRWKAIWPRIKDWVELGLSPERISARMSDDKYADDNLRALCATPKTLRQIIPAGKMGLLD